MGPEIERLYWLQRLEMEYVGLLSLPHDNGRWACPDRQHMISHVLDEVERLEEPDIVSEIRSGLRRLYRSKHGSDKWLDLAPELLGVLNGRVLKAALLAGQAGITPAAFLDHAEKLATKEGIVEDGEEK